MTAAVPGYRPQRLTVTPAAASVQQDVALQIDADSCTAPGVRAVVRLPGDLRRQRRRAGPAVARRRGRGGKPTSGPGAAHSGTRVWATNLAGNYGDRRERGPDLAGDRPDRATPARRPVLMWSQWLKTNSFWTTCGPSGVLCLQADNAIVQVSGDAGTTWATVYGPTGRRHRHRVDREVRRAERGLRGCRASGSDSASREAPGERPTSAGTSTTWVSPRFGSTRRWSTRRTVRGRRRRVTPAVAPTVHVGVGVPPPPAPAAAHSGTQAWATNLAGNYSGSEDSALTSPAIDLTAYRGAMAGGQLVAVAADRGRERPGEP